MSDYLSNKNKNEYWSNNTKDFFTSLLGIPAIALRDQRFISKGVLMKGFAQLIEKINTYRRIELHILPQIYSNLSTLRDNIPINEANELINLWFPQDFPSISLMKYTIHLLNNPFSLAIPIYLNKQGFNSLSCIKAEELKYSSNEIGIPNNTDECLIIEIKVNGQERSPKLIIVEKDKIVTIGSSSNSSICLQDDKLDSSQVQIQCIINKPYKALIQCKSTKYLTLVRIPIHQCWIIAQHDYFLFSENEAFIITKCVSKHRQPQKLAEIIYQNNQNEYIYFSPRLIEDWEDYVINDQAEAELELHIIMGERTGEIIKLKANDKFLIGRGNECELKLLDPGISTIHAEIVYKEDLGWFIKEPTTRGSLNGTWLSLNLFENKKNKLPSPLFPLFSKETLHWKAGCTEGKLKLVQMS